MKENNMPLSLQNIIDAVDRIESKIEFGDIKYANADDIEKFLYLYLREIRTGVETINSQIQEYIDVIVAQKKVIDSLKVEPVPKKKEEQWLNVPKPLYEFNI